MKEEVYSAGPGSRARPKLSLLRISGWLWLGLVVLALVLGLALPIVGARAQAALKADHPPIGEMIAIGDAAGPSYRLHLYCEGQGSPAVILEPPLASPGLTWAHLLPQLAGSTRTCIYDRAGIGWSDPSPRPRTVRVIVEELHDLLARSGIPGPYLLVGYSSSGLITRLYTHTYPGEVAGLVLADPSHEEQLERLQVQASPLLKVLYGLGPAVIRSRVPALFPGWIPVPEGDHLPPPARQNIQALLAADPKFAETAVEELGLVEESMAQVKAARITSLGDIPLIVLAHGIPGAGPSPHAERIWQEMQREQAAASTRGRYRVAPGSTHTVPYDRPDLLVAAIEEVLAEVRGQ